MSEFIRRLNNARGNWNNIKPPESRGPREPIPDGKYQVQIVGNKLSEEGKLNVRYKILKGDYAGRLVFNSINLAYEKVAGDNFGLSLFKGYLQKLRLDLPDLTPQGLNTVLNKTLNMVVEVSLIVSKKNPNYQNVYIDGLVNAHEPSEKETTISEASEDVIEEDIFDDIDDLEEPEKPQTLVGSSFSWLDPTDSKTRNVTVIADEGEKVIIEYKVGRGSKKVRIKKSMLTPSEKAPPAPTPPKAEPKQEAVEGFGDDEDWDDL